MEPTGQVNTQPPFGEYRNDHQLDPSNLVLPDESVVCVSHGVPEELFGAIRAEWFRQWQPYINQGAQDQ